VVTEKTWKEDNKTAEYYIPIPRVLESDTKEQLIEKLNLTVE